LLNTQLAIARGTIKLRRMVARARRHRNWHRNWHRHAVSSR
jgi:hypothetical protein